MEFYAKSKQKELNEKEKERLCNILQKFIETTQNWLEEEEIIIEKYIIEMKKNSLKEWKKLREHQEDIVKCADDFFSIYGDYFSEKEKVLIKEACYWHDMGKTNLLFQILVNPELKAKQTSQICKKKQIPHGYLSALSISEEDFFMEYPEMEENDFRTLVTAIYYHHTRSDRLDDLELSEYSKKYYQKYIIEFLHNPEWEFYDENKELLLFDNQSIINGIIEENQWNQYLLVKGLLNKFDWSVSAGNMVAEEKPDIEKKELKKNIEQKIGEKLRPVQEYMAKHKKENLIITAPTGSGKTEAALLWIDGEKGFYTLPLKVSSNAIYERIKVNYEFSDVSLLHSDSISKYLEEAVKNKKEDTENEEESAIKHYEKAKYLSAPLTVCTVDQLFKFVYKALGTEIFAATLKYSKLVLDEIQAYSPRVVATLIYGLKTIKDMGGRFAIITATFPPVLKYFMERYDLICGRDYQFQDFSKDNKQIRHRFSLFHKEMDIEQIISNGKKKKVLVICNTVSKAQEIYKEILKKTENVWLLHSRFIRKDREWLENEIMQFSKDKDKIGIWVTTQIVEASLDIDFDILYTEMCVGDSLLQRMGRCNRAERYKPIESNVMIFDNRNGVGTNNVYEKEIYERSLECLKKYEGDIFNESCKMEYIYQIYDEKQIKTSHYYQEIEKYLKHFSTISPLEYDKREVNEKFRNINSITIIPDSVYIDNQEFFEQCRELFKNSGIGASVKKILNAKLNSFTMGINLYGKWPEGIDRTTISETMIYRANLDYNFNENSKQGLILNKKEQEIFFA